MALVRIGAAERLVRAAEDELIEGGGLLEMQAVARRAKVSVGLAYHHFGSKAGLIAAVVERFYDRLEEVAFSPSKLVSRDFVGREKERISAYVFFHYDHPFAPLVVGPLSRAPEVLDVEVAFTRRQLTAGAYNLRAAQRAGVIPKDLAPRLTIALMIGGIRQALIGALTTGPRPDPAQLTDGIWTFVAGALRLSAQASNAQDGPAPVGPPQGAAASDGARPAT